MIEITKTNDKTVKTHVKGNSTDIGTELLSLIKNTVEDERLLNSLLMIFDKRKFLFKKESYEQYDRLETLIEEFRKFQK